MSNRLISLTRAYRERSKEKEDQSLWEFAAEKDPHLFSHHPAQPEFRSHVWKIGGLYFCKGCVVTFAGAVFGIVLFALSGWLRWFSDWEIGAIFVGLLLPSVFSSLLQLPRWCRHIGRFLLGILLASAFLMLFVTDSWLIRGVIILTYFVTKTPLERLRNRQNRELSDPS